MSNKLIIFNAFASLWLIISMASGGTILPPLSISSIFFARNFYRALNEADENKVNNILISPTAARSAMTLVFMAAEGRTADEIRSGLILGAAKKFDIVKQHGQFHKDVCNVSNAKSVSIRIATGLYVNDHQELQPDFNLNAAEFFNTQANHLNFTDSENAMQYVNKWLERQTFHTVRDLLSPASFNQESSVILVNSLYFRAKWAKTFATERTSLNDFRIDDNNSVQTPMMRQVGQFRYAESRNLKSKILLLPFEDTDISMLIIMPNDANGLADLELKLSDYDLNEVAVEAVKHEVDVRIPKFKMECDLDLKVPLEKLGITRLFQSGVADLSGLFASKSPELITEARQKLFLNVNEAGCQTDDFKPSRASAYGVNPQRKVFKANQPFVFAIRNSKAVYFVGHFVKP